MTYADLINTEKIMLTPDDVAGVIGCKPESIRCQAREDPQMLGFPVCVLGTRTLIPRAGFIAWLNGTRIVVRKE